MSHVVVLGAGLGGTIMAYELRDLLGSAHRVSVVNKGTQYSFVPSNPWVAVGWRDRKDTTVDLGPVIPPRNVNWASKGKWVHTAKVAFEKYFLHKIGVGQSEPFYENLAMRALGIDKLKAVSRE